MDAFEAFVQGVTKDLASQLRGSQPHETAWNALQAFLHAVDWRERWLRALLAFHTALAATLLLTRRSEAAQAALFLLQLALVYPAERLNALASRNWRSFAGQNYFDERGSFFTTVWCGPLVLFLTAQLVGFLARAARLLVQVKRAELRGGRRAAKPGEGEAAAPSTKKQRRKQA